MVEAFYAVSGLDPAMEPTISCEPGTELKAEAGPAARKAIA